METIRALYFTLPIFGITLSPLAFSVSCGDTIITPTILTEDLVCTLDANNLNALTIVGPTGSLVMNGHSLMCILDNIPVFSDSAGVRIEGISSLLSKGAISNCNYGVFVVGIGLHTIDDMKIENNLEDGIDLRSDQNFAINNYISHNGEDGIDMQGDFNRVTNNYIEFSGRDGIEADNDFGTVTLNYVTGSGRAGIEMQASSNNYISQNIVIGNGDGVSADSGGIVITSLSSSNNVISGNVANGNTPFDLVDRIDPDCTGSNIWTGNFFDTADPSCLD
ncbi:right-handed parallel beta-helix repeat-containing protein [Microbulbifer sp. GL-2]|uniref:right-handed parallel beta-helix repeat-containing protein n=1 Tax=Microbulbifer sp. GL-2 TaxID=2591606 RepID=UPI00117DC2EC|nr:right-handed parallel beta-helix repeat-containing protein [Microbulbifer sp. GL-2]